MPSEETAELTSTEEEESPSFDPYAHKPEFPEYSPICYLDNEITVHCKIEHATRKLWMLTVNWQRLFPLSQWVPQNPHGEKVLRDSGLLRHVVPFAKRINNLDGVVWAERPNIRGLGGTVRVVYRDPGPFW